METPGSAQLQAMGCASRLWQTPLHKPDLTARLPASPGCASGEKEKERHDKNVGGSSIKFLGLLGDVLDPGLPGQEAL